MTTEQTHPDESHDEAMDSNQPECEGEIGILRDENERLAAEVDKLLRAVADAQNRERTARREVEEARKQATTRVARDVITALDHLDLALAQDREGATLDQFISGLDAIRSELRSALAIHGVTLVEPEPGEPFDPNRHEAMAQQPAEGVAPGHIASTFQVGYALNDRVIRPAKVLVTPSEA